MNLWIIFSILTYCAQGSELEPLLFIIFINGLPKLLKHLSKLFTYDCKLIGIIKELGEVLELQRDIDINYRDIFSFLPSSNAKKIFLS